MQGRPDRAGIPAGWLLAALLLGALIVCGGAGWHGVSGDHAATACEASEQLTSDSTGVGSLGALLAAMAGLAFGPLLWVRRPPSKSPALTSLVESRHLRFCRFPRTPMLSVLLQVFRL